MAFSRNTSQDDLEKIIKARQFKKASKKKNSVYEAY